MQLAAGVVRVVHARDAEAELEPQVLVVPQRLRHLDDVLARTCSVSSSRSTTTDSTAAA